MAGGQVPKTGQCKLFRDSTNDNSVQDAVFGVKGVNYTNIQSLATNCNSALIDSSYGTRNSTPTNALQFRGYPRPEIDMNYFVVHTGSFPNQQTEYLRCLPTLNASIGFAITLTLEVQEISANVGGLGTFTYPTFTFNAGSTTPSSSSLTPIAGGYYVLNTTYTQPSHPYNITVNSTVNSVATSSYYLTEADPYQALLEYEAATSVNALDFYNYSTNSCSGSIVPTIPTTVYSTSTEIAEGAVLYQEAGLINVITNSYGATNIVGLPINPVAYDWFAVTSGTVGALNSC